MHTIQIAARFREVLLNGSWISTNFKTQLEDVTLEEATTEIANLNTIALLAFHIHYYVAGVLNVLEGGSLDIRDKFSFDMPPMNTAADWDVLRSRMWKDAEQFAQKVEQLPDSELWNVFTDEKYGNYYRNMEGMIEHCYYHLGQIVLLKKLVRGSK
ncbi:MAG: hypothetical protein RJA20_186 [Bacteroidota bacterium]|jgi:uncharacterized damage-inducible protein DinB